MPNQLMESLLDNGILNSYFFNGRILDADALKTDQQANRRQHGQLGRAIGDGIVWGLEVSVESPGSVSAPAVVKVKEGLAINRRGQALELAVSGQDPTQCLSGGSAGATDSISLALAKATGPQPMGSDLFTLCTLSGPTVATLTGVSLLVMSPASGFRGSAPMKSLSAGGKDAGCGSRYAVEGVTFRLVGFPSEGQPLGDSQTLQNRLAHRCYGTEELVQGMSGKPAFVYNPFDFQGHYGALDILRDNGALTDCDVPLALIYQTQAGVQFCDMWAVRRPPTPSAAPDVWPLQIGGRRLAEAQAMFVQFQAQLQTLFLSAANRSQLAAKDHFRYLPPAGYLRIGAGEFGETPFFSGLTTRRFTLDPAVQRFLIASSFSLDPIDLTSATPPQIALYESPAADGYLLFARIDATSPIGVTPPPSEPVEKGKASLVVFITFPEVQTSESAKAAHTLMVTAEDENGALYHAEDKTISPFLKLGAQTPTGRDFFFSDLPAGTYTVTVRATSYAAVRRIVRLQPDEEKEITLLMMPFRAPEGRAQQPGGSMKAGWMANQWYAKAKALGDKVDWQVREDLPQWTRQPDPPPDVMQQFQEWAYGLQQQYPKAPVDPTDIRVVIDPSYTPDQVANDFYAYVQFGENGAYMPLLLAATDKALDRPVALGKGSLVGVDGEMIAQLAGAGIDDLSLLAASPKGLIAEALKLSPDAGQGLVTAGRSAVSALKNSVMQFNGVTEQTRQALAELNINDAVTLANADPAALQAGLGDQAFANRLVEEARGAVSPELWSVGAATLGLTAAEVNGLVAKGVLTQGQVVAQRAAGMEATLGLATTELDRIGEAFQNVSTRLQITQAALTPVASLTTVDATSALTLAAAGLSDAGKLATADVATVAARLNGQTELAGRMIAEAKNLQLRIGGGG